MNHLAEIPPRTLDRMKRRVLEATDADRPTTLAIMRMVKGLDLRWPVSRVTRNRVHNVLEACGFYFEYETGLWYEKYPVPDPTPHNLLKEAISVIEGLAEQQAMSDDWYEEPLARFKTALKEIPQGPLTSITSAP